MLPFTPEDNDIACADDQSCLPGGSSGMLCGEDETLNIEVEREGDGRWIAEVTGWAHSLPDHLDHLFSIDSLHGLLVKCRTVCCFIV